MGVPFVCKRFSLATSGATQDFTIAGETRTPVAAYFYLVGATANATSTDHHIQSWGATDGTNEWFGSIRSDTGEATSDCKALHDTSGVVAILDASGTVDGQLSFNSWITGGVRLDHDNNPSTAYLLVIWFFFEGDYQVGTVTTSGTAGVATSVAVSGFSPTFLITGEYGSGTDFGSTVRDDVYAGIGFVADNEASGTLQVAGMYFERDGVNTTENAQITDNSVGSGHVYRLATGGGEHFIQFAFTTAGFSATQINSDEVRYFGYLAGAIAGMDVWAGHLSTPAGTTGSYTFTEPGFEASFGMLCQTALLNESHTSGAATEGYGMGFFTQTDQFSGCGSSDDNRSTGVSNTLTRSYASTNLIDFQAPPGTSFYQAAWTASTASGFTVNIATGNANARLLPALLFEPFPERVAVDEVLGVFEDIGITHLGLVEEVLGIEEVPLGATQVAVDEVLGVFEGVEALSGVAVDETLGVFEEVDEFTVFAPAPAPPNGEGGFARVVEGEGGSPGALIGSG